MVCSDYFDARALADHSSLRELDLRAAQGRLVHAAALAPLTRLWSLSTQSCYDLDGAGFPALRSIEYLSLRWLRRDDGAALKKKLTGVRHHRILGTRADRWIADNANNPFRDWADDNAALGRGAAKAWKDARSAKRAKPERVLEDLIAALNKLDARHDLETHHRELCAMRS